MKPLRIIYLLLACCTWSVAAEPIPLPAPVRHVYQRTNKDCGQAAVAMAAGISLDEAYRRFGSNGLTTADQKYRVLRGLGFRVGWPAHVSTPGTRNYYRTKAIGIAIIETGGRVRHCQYWHKGKVYDPARIRGSGSLCMFIEVYGRESR